MGSNAIHIITFILPMQKELDSVKIFNIKNFFDVYQHSVS